MMRINYMKSFKEVVEEGSLLAASKNLNMSVSTISMHVNSVEKFFSAKLLERNVNGVKLTREGELAYNSIIAVFEHLERTKRSIENLTTSTVKVCIGCVGVPIIADIQMGYKKIKPQVNVDVKLSGEYSCLELLNQGEANIVLATFPTPLKLDDGYVVEEIGKDEFVLIVPPDHEFTRKKTVTMEEVLSHPMVTMHKGYTSNFSLSDFESADGITKELKENEIRSIECSANGIFSQIYGVSSGLGTAITSYVLSKKYEEGNLVKIKRLFDFSNKRPIYAITKKRDLENSAIKDFYRYLTEKGRRLLKSYIS